MEMFPKSAKDCEWPSWPHTVPLYPQLEHAAQEEEVDGWRLGDKAGHWTLESREVGVCATFKIGTASKGP